MSDGIMCVPNQIERCHIIMDVLRYVYKPGFVPFNLIWNTHNCITYTVNVIYCLLCVSIEFHNF